MTVHTSVLSAAGFDPVGPVFGTTVMDVGWTGGASCGWRPTYPSRRGPAVALPPRPAGHTAYARALRGGRDTALDRMCRAAGALGADGVVAVRFTEQRLAGRTREFRALGVAVRSRGRQRPGAVFSTELAAPEFVTLLAAGWVPAGIVRGLAVAVRHEDWRTASSLGFLVPNTELAGHTELITHVRAEARRDVAARAAALGADAVLTSGLRSAMWATGAGEDHTDQVAECVVTGTAVARFHPGHPPSSSPTVLPLRSTR
ncbi:heavy metal-binding domain-containing protein [Actinoplanes oblitus]|uniref:Heavy metal-binding domain-containing protein n=1 Tax=Actinoplanes oblitus TaxID=3040509 RepID=A0ABY8W8A6_9ACTN|nr:heavy metal-binding domain-containing protein [Actinoplanes oblitus]WIM93587.1 heavy metal-binding domain-containing protein [Actinoplanes oblitus]